MLLITIAPPPPISHAICAGSRPQSQDDFTYIIFTSRGLITVSTDAPPARVALIVLMICAFFRRYSAPSPGNSLIFDSLREALRGRAPAVIARITRVSILLKTPTRVSFDTPRPRLKKPAFRAPHTIWPIALHLISALVPLLMRYFNANTGLISLAGH